MLIRFVIIVKKKNQKWKIFFLQISERDQYNSTYPPVAKIAKGPKKKSRDIIGIKLVLFSSIALLG